MFSLVEQLESRQMMSATSFSALSSGSLLTSTSVYAVAPKVAASPTTSLGGLYSTVTPVSTTFPIGGISTPVTPISTPFPIGGIYIPAPPPSVFNPGNIGVIIKDIPHYTPAYVSSGVLSVEGRLDANKIGVDVSGANYVVTLNGSTYTFGTAGVTGIKITGGIGADGIALGVAVNVPATIHGDAGNDTIVGGSAGDQLFGDDGSDLLTGAAGADLLSGGLGFDSVSYQEKTRGVTVTLDGVADDGTPLSILSSGVGSAFLQRTRIFAAENDNAMSDVEGIKATGYDDVLTGNAAANLIYGYEGNDQLDGLDGNDSLYGGYGNDTVNGGYGDDQMWGEGGDDVLSGGWGTDAARYDEGGRLLGVTVAIDDVANDGGSFEKDNVRTDVENLYGTSGGDVFLGTAANNTFFGNAGGDQLFGLGGYDTLFGGAGDDGLFGGDGNDYMLAGDDNDLILGGFGNDTGYGGNGDDQVRGEWGDDQVYGQAGNDKVYGDDGADQVNGDAGDDQLFGGANADILRGGDGNDVLVTVGGGVDQLTGGNGYDGYWADAPTGLFGLTPGDAITDVDFTESITGAVHLIGNFSNSVGTGLFSSDKGPVSKELLGQNLTDPTPLVAGTATRNFRGNPLFGTYGPVADDVDQNALGDCWFMATLASTARSNGNVIRQSIADLGDGTYAVKFRASPFSTQDIYIRVDADLPVGVVNNPVYGGLGKNNSLWSALMEKAYTWVRGQDGTAVQTAYATIASGTAIEAAGALNLGYAGGANNFPSVDNAGNWIRDRVYTNKLVLAATSKTANPLFVSNHLYSITGITQVSAGNWTVTLRNPWAADGGNGNDGTNDGYVTVSLATFLPSMTRIDSFIA